MQQFSGKRRKPLIVALVVLSLGAVLLLDFRVSPAWHVAYLYCLPIFLAALAWRYVGALATGFVSMGLHQVVHAHAGYEPSSFIEADLLTFALFLIVGLATAKLAHDRRMLTAYAAQLESRNRELAGLNAKLADLSRAKSDFVGLASHELKSPLAVILGGAETIASGRLRDPEQNARLAMHIRDASRRMQHIIDSLLDLAAIEAGRLQITRESADLVALVEESRLLLPDAWGRRITVDTLGEPLPPIGVDSEKIVQVLVNLLSNACKYSPPAAPVQVVVSNEGAALHIVVRDHGRGIPEEDLPHLFDRYYRGRGGANGRACGNGLGLSISRDIVRAHGGDITIENWGPEGSTFRVVLPLSEPLSLQLSA